MVRARGSWTGGTLKVATILKPHQLARALFHPAWVPDSPDPSVERLKRIRTIAGLAATLGVYTFLAGGFDFTELLTNTLTAALVLLFLTPLTVGVMLLVWRRTGTVRQLRVPLFDALKLLLLFVCAFAAPVLLGWAMLGLGREDLGLFLVLCLVMLWLFVFVFAAALRVSGNFFGTGAVHRSLPALLAVVTCWLMSLPDLITGDLKGLGLGLGVVFILAAPVTVTGIALLELRRLKRRYGIRLADHPETRGPLPGPVPQTPAPASHPASASRHAPAHGPGQPHIPVQGNPYVYPQSPYAPGTPGRPHGASAPQNPYAR
ncbi:hypothetical protein [Streptomyces sp. KMM 9044]|uniref:hypothetical protein n=1 Tax=Streptomyces sp. KMM 9044 TaxID=2744474 RepID=UPI00215175CB|nr:hypothetical protein [Streptomyces sp. KMM 9044]WAX80636.1 hypothetical protein HUV60_026180 [Streptomyces sp. KMM 9044]